MTMTKSQLSTSRAQKILSSDNKKEIAEKAGVTKSFVDMLLRRERHASSETAKKLESACKELGFRINKTDWIFTDDTENKYFTNKENG